MKQRSPLTGLVSVSLNACLCPSRGQRRCGTRLSEGDVVTRRNWCYKRVKKMGTHADLLIRRTGVRDFQMNAVCDLMTVMRTWLYDKRKKHTHPHAHTYTCIHKCTVCWQVTPTSDFRILSAPTTIQSSASQCAKAEAARKGKHKRLCNGSRQENYEWTTILHKKRKKILKSRNKWLTRRPITQKNMHIDT